MNRKSFFAFLAFLWIATTTFGQTQIKDAANYSQAIQVDSSDLYIIGSLIDKSNKSKFNFGISYRIMNNWTNVWLYNSHTHESRKIFPGTINAIAPLYPVPVAAPLYNYSFQAEYRNSMIFPNHFFFLVRTDEYNKDGILDEDDPTAIYISTKTGEGLTRITSPDQNILTWTVSRDFKTVLLKVQKDKNGDKKFSDENEIFYQVDIDPNISKIRMIPVTLQ